MCSQNTDFRSNTPKHCFVDKENCEFEYDGYQADWKYFPSQGRVEFHIRRDNFEDNSWIAIGIGRSMVCSFWLVIHSRHIFQG